MNTINQASRSAFSFISRLPEITPQNKKIAAMALAVFGLITAIYFAYSRSYDKIQFNKKRKSDPVVDLEPILRSPNLKKLDAGKDLEGTAATNLFDSLSAKTDRTSQNLDELDAALIKIQDDFQELQTLTLDLAKQVDEIKSQQQVPVVQPAIQIQNAREAFIKKFNDEYCVLSDAVRGQFPKGIKLDDFFADELKDVISKYPNMRFYFNWSIGARFEIGQAFADAVKKGPDDAMWCVVQVCQGHTTHMLYRLTFAESQKIVHNNDLAIFRFPVGLDVNRKFVKDNVISKNDNVANENAFYQYFLGDLADEKKRALAMASVKAFK